MTESKGKDVAAGNLVLAVRLGKDLHAIPIESVEEVLPALPIETIPGCPDFLRGVVFVRGHLIPVVSGAERLGVKNHQRPLEPPIICLRIGDRLMGIEFDEAVDLIELGSGQSLTAHELGAREGFFVGIVELDGEIIRLLDPQKLINSEETAQLARLPRTG